MSRILNQIYRDFAKEEVTLSKESVSLGIVDDIQKNISSIENAISEANTQLSKMKAANDLVLKADAESEKVAGQSEKARKKISDSQSKAAGVLEKAEKAAKDLGVDFKAINGYSKLDSLYNEAESLSKDINGFNWITVK